MITTKTMVVTSVGVLLLGGMVLPERAVADNGELSQTLVQGQIVTSYGHAAAGARVAVFALPFESVGNHATVGERTRFPLLASGIADSDGRFVLASSLSSVHRFTGGSGSLNVYVVAQDTSGATADITLGLHEILEPRLGGGPSLAPIQLSNFMTSSGLSRAGLTGAGPIVSTPSADYESTVTPGVSGRTPAPFGACGRDLLEDLGKTKVLVGTSYVVMGGVRADLEYSASASTTLGVGVSPSGKSGSYSASGAVSVSSTKTLNFPASGGKQEDYTYFDYGKFGYWCDSFPGYKSYSVSARYWMGGADTSVPANAPTANYCVPQVRGSKFELKTSKATNWSAGAKTSGKIGINLSAQTGYTTAAKLVYDFYDQGGRLCGVDGYPAQTPGRLVAKR